MKKALITELTGYSKVDDSGDLRTAFWRVNADQLDDFEAQTGVELPIELREFYHRVGHGRIQLSRTGDWAEFDLNIIVEPERLASLILHRDPSHMVDAAIYETGDLPFFDIGSHSFLVMRPSSAEPNAIYWPYGDVPVSKDIWEFSDRLLDNPRFYHDS